MDDIKRQVITVFENCSNQHVHEWGVIKNKVKDDLGKLLYDRTRRTPHDPADHYGGLTRKACGKEGDVFEKEKGVGGLSLLPGDYRGDAGHDGNQLFYHQPQYLLSFAALTLAAGTVALVGVIRFRTYAQTVLRSAFKSFDRDQESYLSKLSFPVAITGKYDEVVWGNGLFQEMLCENKDCVGESVTAFTSGVRLQDISEGQRHQYHPQRAEIHGLRGKAENQLHFIFHRGHLF